LSIRKGKVVFKQPNHWYECNLHSQYLIPLLHSIPPPLWVWSDLDLVSCVKLSIMLGTCKMGWQCEGPNNKKQELSTQEKLYHNSSYMARLNTCLSNN
jgi:hypothetical protein